ncbi:Uu.00g104780.m01.CDS01 [Anthostomella pinea]|uniref:Uu.00g104780.m01.CDS01 n=1 Tax=Anthostomella pinea TaxID=933095 RepID=A0AAI8VEI2_9PEZI|nr:Uu.00g104780.m01.CDS01 [Anthostomella pinea]
MSFDEWLASDDSATLFDFSDCQGASSAASADMGTGPIETPYQQEPPMFYPSVPSDLRASDQNGETRMLLLLILSRLETQDRLMTKIDSVMDKIDRFMSRVDSAMENIRTGLDKFTADMIGFLKGCVVFAGNQDVNADEEMGSLLSTKAT